jgi:hypothetical protein
MNIYDLAEFDDETVRGLVEATLSKYSELRRFYDDEFIRKLARRRHNLDNYLLLQLARPSDEFFGDYWQPVVEDLLVLAPFGGWEKFKAKFRKHERSNVESALTELSLSAWMARNCGNVVLEPPTDGGQNCDFKGETSPEIFWEIKTLRDLDFIEVDKRIYLRAQAAFRRIEQPYVLHMRALRIAEIDLATAVRDVKKQLAEHHRKGGIAQGTFGCNGLVVEIIGVSKRKFGYVGSSMGKSMVFGSEQALKVGRSIRSAKSQIPADAAGIVVIDSSVADWIDEDDVIDACFGVVSMAFVGGREMMVRGDNAVFRPDCDRRVSAVAWYTSGHRRLRDTAITVVHNPYARIPLGNSVLEFEGVKQIRSVETGDGFRRMEIALTPISPELAEPDAGN